MSAPRRALLILWVALWAVIALAAGELLVRWRGEFDPDGTFYYKGLAIRPWHLPAARTTELLERYEREGSSYLRYDADLGWSPRPGGVSEDGLYRANAQGMRGPREVSPLPSPDRVRLLLMGDSFIHGDDVPWEQSLAASLERWYAERGVPVEIVNLAVRGFGFDQALLRWRRDGAPLQPDLVLMGLQPENSIRNVNLLRMLVYPTTAIPFSKPRFVLQEGALTPINSPTAPPEELPGIVRDFSRWRWAPYEHFYTEEEYTPRWWSASKLASLLVDLRPGRPQESSATARAMAPDSEAHALTRAILGALEREVAPTPLTLLYVPVREIAARRAGTGADPWASLKESACEGHRCLDPWPALGPLIQSGGIDAAYGRHFTASANAEIGRWLGPQLVADEAAAREILERRRARQEGAAQK